MIGPHGTGKSTLVQQLAAENPGTIYLSVPNANGDEAIAKEFTSLFAQTISWRQAFLRRLLQFAKTSADKGYLEVREKTCLHVGVFAEYTGSSRAKVVTIGDFTRSEALKYLTTKSSLNIDKPTAEKIADFTGNRIIAIINIQVSMKLGHSLEAIFEGMKEKAWEDCVLKENDASKSTLKHISKKLLKEELITESEFYKLCGNDSVGQSFIDRNIFAIVPKPITAITFGSKVMETSIKENLGI
ncbi:hypothetical protein EDC01DRAFT_627308 [Geopyxis carbonaria]|nr:hypothetical protein EDC01DRAFT_627308 [Geopyxis carbonaria]